MEIGWIMFAFFLLVTMIFVVIAIFLPEWVGITGKKAQQYIHEQSGEGKSTDVNSTSVNEVTNKSKDQ